LYVKHMLRLKVANGLGVLCSQPRYRLINCRRAEKSSTCEKIGMTGSRIADGLGRLNCCRSRLQIDAPRPAVRSFALVGC